MPFYIFYLTNQTTVNNVEMYWFIRVVFVLLLKTHPLTMKHLLLQFTAILMMASLSAQNIQENQFYSPTNTGSNMTLGFNTNDLDDFVGDVIGAFNSGGKCIGLESVKDDFFTMALWGNDQGSQIIDGLIDGEIPTFAVLKNNGQVVPIASINVFSGYETNAMSVSNSILTAGCTVESYLEYHTQGYNADVDNGSCQIKTYSLDVTPELFQPISFTDNNMIIGMNDQTINLFEGGTLGTFFDLDQDGVLDCISSTEIPGKNNDADGFFTISLWGDDQLTDEVDGLTDGQTPIFAILTKTNHVLAFESTTEIQGYAGNAFITLDEITFDLTIYGCMDSNYCNYDPDAEEDDNSCEGTPGCIDDHFVEYDANASCSLTDACSTLWKDAYNQVNTENELNLTTISQLEDSIANFSSPISIDIVEGWNIIGFTLDQEQDVVATLDGIVDHVNIAKNNEAKVYWPEFGFNGIGNFIPGQGYQIKVSQAIDGFMYPKISTGQRIALQPTVPQWVIDMPVEMHPNDIKSLVRVVNLLGQEVKISEVPKGSPLIYLYNDGTVKKELR